MHSALGDSSAAGPAQASAAGEGRAPTTKATVPDAADGICCHTTESESLAVDPASASSTAPVMAPVMAPVRNRNLLQLLRNLASSCLVNPYI
jgi:hypothetical protein